MANRDAASAPSGVVSRRRVLSTVGVGVGTALAGCSSRTGTPTPQPAEATLTIRLRNRDDQPRDFEVRVTQGGSVTESFSGTLPADEVQSVEMVATFRATEEQHEFSINTAGGQRGRTWEPTDCGDFVVDAFVEGGEPGFETECRER